MYAGLWNQSASYRVGKGGTPISWTQTRSGPPGSGNGKIDFSWKPAVAARCGTTRSDHRLHPRRGTLGRQGTSAGAEGDRVGSEMIGPQLIEALTHDRSMKFLSPWL